MKIDRDFFFIWAPRGRSPGIGDLRHKWNCCRVIIPGLYLSLTLLFMEVLRLLKGKLAFSAGGGVPDWNLIVWCEQD